jgi:hypothetical protein
MTRGTVDPFAEQIGMAVVAGVFGDHVDDDSAQ